MLPHIVRIEIFCASFESHALSWQETSIDTTVYSLLQVRRRSCALLGWMEPVLAPTCNHFLLSRGPSAPRGDLLAPEAIAQLHGIVDRLLAGWQGGHVDTTPARHKKISFTYAYGDSKHCNHCLGNKTPIEYCRTSSIYVRYTYCVLSTRCNDLIN